MRPDNPSLRWDDIPRPVRDAIEEHTGPVRSSIPGGEGLSTSVRLLLDTQSGGVFVKGCGPLPDDPQLRRIAEHQRRRLALGAELASFVTPISPPLLWEIRTGEWHVTGWPILPGRPMADLAPGSPDIPHVTGVLSTLSAIPAPDMLTATVQDEWGRWADHPGLLGGDMLVHSDQTPSNYVVSDDRAWLVDWGWSLRGPAWVTPALLVLALMEAGWEPADAETALEDVPGWREAPHRAVAEFARAEARQWAKASEAAPTNIRLARAAITRKWAAHREHAGQRS